MVDAPEKIWIEQDDCPYFYEESELTEVGSPVTEYVRADLYAALEAQLAEANKALVIANANLDNMEFLSIEGFMDWQQEHRAARRALEAQGGEDD